MKKFLYKVNTTEEVIALAKSDVVNAYLAFEPFFVQEFVSKNRKINVGDLTNLKHYWFKIFFNQNNGWKPFVKMQMYLDAHYSDGKSYFFKDIDLKFKGSNALVLALMIRNLNSLNLDAATYTNALLPILLSRWEMIGEAVKVKGGWERKAVEFKCNDNSSTLNQLAVMGVRENVIDKTYLDVIRFTNCSNVVDYDGTEIGRILQVIHNVMQMTADELKSKSEKVEVEVDFNSEKTIKDVIDEKPISMKQALSEAEMVKNMTVEELFSYAEKYLEDMNSGKHDKELLPIYEKMSNKEKFTKEDWDTMNKCLNYYDFFKLSRDHRKEWVSWAYKNITKHFNKKEEDVVVSGLSNVIEEF